MLVKLILILMLCYLVAFKLMLMWMLCNLNAGYKLMLIYVSELYVIILHVATIYLVHNEITHTFMYVCMYACMLIYIIREKVEHFFNQLSIFANDSLEIIFFYLGCFVWFTKSQDKNHDHENLDLLALSLSRVIVLFHLWKNSKVPGV